jgi:hypothetical protein
VIVFIARHPRIRHSAEELVGDTIDPVVISPIIWFSYLLLLISVSKLAALPAGLKET